MSRTPTPFYHGGVAGLRPGDLLLPSPPHASDGCPICVARAEGRTLTVGEFRRWLTASWRFARDARRPDVVRQIDAALDELRDAPDSAPMDPPSAERAVYVTASREYATWYAARSRGDLYEVAPVGGATPSTEDNFPTWTCEAARVVRVLRRGVVLVRRERREIARLWEKADRARDRARGAA